MHPRFALISTGCCVLFQRFSFATSTLKQTSRCRCPSRLQNAKVKTRSGSFKSDGNYPISSRKRETRCCVLIRRQTVVAVPKEYNVRRHFMSCHQKKYEALIGKIHENTVSQLKASLGKQQDLFHKAVKTSDETVRASFFVSELIAKSPKPFIY